MQLDETTQARKAETDEGRSEELFRLLMEHVREYAIFVLDPTGKVMTWNKGAQQLKGYTREEIVGQHFSKFYLPEAVQNQWPQRELEMAIREGRFADEGWRVRKDGSIFWASVMITALRDDQGELRGFAKVTRDMSERREWEERLRKLNKDLHRRIAQLAESQRLIQLRTLELQDLSGQLLRAQDEERRRIARELHDELGQQLTALKIMLEIDALKPGTKPHRTEALEMTDKLMQNVRNISYLLHPPLLDEAGLIPAIHWFVDGIRKRSKIDVELIIKPEFFPRLTSEMETTLFRIVQEALTNVYRHSGSSKAQIELTKTSDSVVLRIRDYGKGIDPSSARPTAFALGVGIGGMRERMKQLRGDLKISNANPGTQVEATMPLFDSSESVVPDLF